MIILKILFFPVWFPIWLVWKILSGIAHFILSSISLFFKLLLIAILILAVVVLIWLA